MRDVELLVKAASLAASAHLAQMRKGLPEPYINHPCRVAVAAEECGLSHEAIAAAYLHDVVEDTSVTLHDLIHCGFPERTLLLVNLLTKWWPDDASLSVKLQGKNEYYARICSDPEAVVLKLLDRADNLLDMVKVVGEKRAWAMSYLKKTAYEFPPLLLANRNVQAIARYNEALGKLSRALLALRVADPPAADVPLP